MGEKGRNMDAQDLAQKLGEAAIVRVCHDLASPAGALSNGVEIIGMAGDDPAFMQEAVGLLKNSSQALSARLEFYRAAFGAPNAQALVAVGAKAVTEKYLSILGDKSRRYTLGAFPPFPVSGIDHKAEWWRLALLLVLVGADAAPFGADISVNEENGWPVLNVVGRQAMLSEQFFVENGAITAIDPRGIASVALRYHAAAEGLRVIGANGDGSFQVCFAKNDL